MYKKNDKGYYLLDQQDVNQIEYIHSQLWMQKAEMGPRLQFEVFQEFLEKRGFLIVSKLEWGLICGLNDALEKKATPETGDMSPEQPE